MRKDVLGCVQPVVGKNKLLVKFKNGKEKNMSSCPFVLLCSKEEVEMDEPKSNLPEK